ncbi:hypothetical protein LTR78_006399 [Recurvomyces mirabilis]|uniref:Uncharacterized protein n=1 Tax=Recurvomyces mirabilis TaxID=574656 RepID=A0AAE0WLD8_9PEZI|nr:hypothetical protein LTR78_006399 [Recurvomyces mirabilis]KAK5152286.1 hypothetical protein LTS14_008663 [Recurvomyces mirabilis]
MALSATKPARSALAKRPIAGVNQQDSKKRGPPPPPYSETPPSQETAKKPRENNVDNGKLRISMDYGTATLAVAFAFVRPGRSLTQADIHNISFGKDCYAPQIAAWANDGTFHWGYGVHEALKKGEIKLDQTITLWKLLLYKDHATSKMAERADAALGSRTLNELLEAHLRDIMTKVKQSIKTHTSTVLALKDEHVKAIDDIPCELLLSVPQMWKPPANIRMTNAAKRAGIPCVELVYEPQSAAAYYTHNIRDTDPQQMRIGDVLLVADIGGGTGDFVSYRYETDSDAGAKVRLAVVKAAKGALCGSVWVTEKFLAWLKNQAPSGWQSLCNKLGLSDALAVAQATSAFDTHKQNFGPHDTQDVFITLRGVAGAKMELWDKRITHAQMVGFFKPVIAEIFKCIDDQLTPHTREMIIPGGFGRSEYLLDLLRKKYPRIRILEQYADELGSFHCVARGSLSRYRSIKQSTWPSTGSFGIGQDEPWDAKIHVDATKIASRSCRQTTWDEKLVEYDRITGKVPMVYMRWLPLLSRSDHTTSTRSTTVTAQTITTCAWQITHIPPSQESISLQVYYTDHDIPRHAPMLHGMHFKQPGAALRDEFEGWGEELVLPLEDLKKMGHELMENVKGEEVYEIHYRVVLRCCGADVGLTWEVAKPGVEVLAEQDPMDVDAEMELAGHQVFEIVTSSHNPMPRTNVDD